jgi:hypothetical protein
MLDVSSIMEKSHLIMLDRYPVSLEVDRYTDTGKP